MITKRLQRSMLQILLVWFLFFLVLASITIQDLDYEPHTAVPEPVLIVQENPQPAAVSEPAPQSVTAPVEHAILARGRKAGHGQLGNGVVHWDGARAELTITMPWSGSLGEYTAFRFDKVEAHVFDLHGQWQVQLTNTPVQDKSCPVRLVQTGQHGSFVRFSLVGHCSGEQEIRYTKDSLTLVLSNVQAQAAGKKAH